MPSPESPPPNAGELLSLETPLSCHCPTSGLRVELSTPQLLFLCCPRCGDYLAGRPILGPGTSGPTAVERLVLTPEEERQLRQALAMSAEEPLPAALQQLLDCTLPVPLAVAQTRLAQRPRLLPELSAALFGPDDELRRLALRLVARMPQPPIALRAGALHAIQGWLADDVGAATLQGALMALHPLASLGRAEGLRAEVERIARRAAERTDEAGALTHQLASAVLAAIERSAAAKQAQARADLHELLSQLHAGHTDAARAVLERAYPTSDPDDPDGGMTGRIALCEEAVRTLASQPKTDATRAQIETLLQWALAAAEIYASWATAGGEGLSRMVQVNRLRGRLRRGA